MCVCVCVFFHQVVLGTDPPFLPWGPTKSPSASFNLLSVRLSPLALSSTEGPSSQPSHGNLQRHGVRPMGGRLADASLALAALTRRVPKPKKYHLAQVRRAHGSPRERERATDSQTRFIRLTGSSSLQHACLTERALCLTHHQHRHHPPVSSAKKASWHDSTTGRG